MYDETVRVLWELVDRMEARRTVTTWGYGSRPVWWYFVGYAILQLQHGTTVETEWQESGKGWASPYNDQPALGVGRLRWRDLSLKFLPRLRFTIERACAWCWKSELEHGKLLNATNV